MGGRQFLLVKRLMNGETLDLSTHATKGFKSLERHFGGASHKLDESSLFLFVKFVQDFPKRPDDRGVLGVSVVFGVVF